MEDVRYGALYVAGTISPRLRGALKEYAELRTLLDAIDEGMDAFPDTAAYAGQVFRLHDDPRVTEILDSFGDAAHASWKMNARRFLLEEDYEAAAIVTGESADELAERYADEAVELREIRAEYGLPEPNGDDNTTPRERALFDRATTLLGTDEDISLRGYVSDLLE